MGLLLNTVAARSKAWTVFARSNNGIVGSNPAWGMDIYVFILFVLSYVQVAASWRATDCVYDQEIEKAANAQQRAVEPYIDR
jgi:hypothetical protein